MDLLLVLTEPGRLLVGDGVIDAGTAMGFHSGQMPWWVQSDLLFTKDRNFVGIVLYAGKSDAVITQQFAAASDPKIAHYLPNEEATRLPRYEGLVGADVSVLELRWSAIEPDHQVVMQLNDEWYYSSPHPAADDFPSAWGYSGIEDIIATEGLAIPQFHY